MPCLIPIDRPARKVWSDLNSADLVYVRDHFINGDIAANIVLKGLITVHSPIRIRYSGLDFCIIADGENDCFRGSEDIEDMSGWPEWPVIDPDSIFPVEQGLRMIENNVIFQI